MFECVYTLEYCRCIWYESMHMQTQLNLVEIIACWISRDIDCSMVAKFTAVVGSLYWVYSSVCTHSCTAVETPSYYTGIKYSCVYTNSCTRLYTAVLLSTQSSMAAVPRGVNFWGSKPQKTPQNHPKTGHWIFEIFEGNG